MSYSKLFCSGFRKRNQDHFAAIVRIAMKDGKVNNIEKAFLYPFAQKLEISKKIYTKILNDYKKRHINPLAELKKKDIRLFDSAKIVYDDVIKDKIEVRLLTKIGIGL